ncbi:DUF1642 domain-containing protein [Lactococcus lactis]|uniref:DUF1642 domain-containing protein n=1 Tax=Lactococcus lactis TaxID=1358 RepID=UPI001C1F6E6F|nr:DUF1642 domain-containing protein [Lactococcus lactis]MBU7532852.1 DUF1642 domain-containing protein [Lactococcus lactis]
MTKFEEEFNYLIELSGKVLIGQVDAEAFEKNRIAFFEKYEIDQQQALPVVPECVAGVIESIPDNYSAFEAFDLIKSKVETFPPEENKDWLQVYNWLCEGIENHDIFALAFITGKYTVEKPQLFYLKHIDMSKRNSINDLYLKKHIHADLTENGEHRLSHAMSAKGIYPSKEYCAFTQQEIDSMQTGSYEQIEVTE